MPYGSFVFLNLVLVVPHQNQFILLGILILHDLYIHHPHHVIHILRYIKIPNDHYQYHANYLNLRV